PALGHRKRRIRGHRDDARQLASDERAYEVDPVAREDQRAVARSASGLQQRANRPGLELEPRVRERSPLFLAVGQDGVDAARSPLVRLCPHKGGEGWCCRFRCRRCSPVGRTAEARSKAAVRPRTPAANTTYLLRAKDLLFAQRYCDTLPRFRGLPGRSRGADEYARSTCRWLSRQHR